MSKLERDTVDAEVKAAADTARTVVDRNERSNRRADRILAAVAAALLAVVTGFGVTSVVQQNQAHDRTAEILQRILAVTNPASPYSKASNKRLGVIVTDIELCLENYMERVVAQATHQPAPAARAGCPTQGDSR